MKTYVALLRGINVGGHKLVPMAKLKNVFEGLGFKNVRTTLATGNVIFDTEAEKAALRGVITTALGKAFGFEIPVIIRAADDMRALTESDPFKGIAVTPQMRLYVTFLFQKPKSKLRAPYISSDKSFTIIHISDTEVISVLTLGPKGGTVDVMKILEKEFGNDITTRNWNTVLKLVGT